MKITSEELDNNILKKLNAPVIEQLQEGIKHGEICKNSQEFRNVIDTYLTIFSAGDKTMGDLVFNCLLTGIEIGYLIAEDKIEIQQLEEMCGITKGRDNDRSG